MEMPKIYSKGASEKQKKFFELETREKREKTMIPFDGEEEKSHELTLFIEKINTILMDEFAKMGIGDAWRELEIERVHVLKEELIEKYFNEDTSFHRGLENFIVLKSPVNLISCLHEAIHHASYISMLIYGNNDRLNNRSGFSLSRMYDGGDATFFSGFNEGFTDLLVGKFLDEHQDEFESEFGLSEEKIKEKKWYLDQGEIINLVIEKIAQKKGCRYDDVFDEWEKKYFQGGLFFLRDIKEAFGKGAIDIISHLKKNMSEETHHKTMEFFSVKDAEKRKEIYEQLKENNFEIKQ